MLPLLIDQDLDQVILRGLLLRIPGLNFVTAHQVDLSSAPDPVLLIWAAEQSRIVVTHDRRTMPYHAAELMEKGKKLAGLIVVSRRLPLNQVIEELEIIVLC